MEEHTREPQYQYLIELAAKHVETFGLMVNQAWFDDPKRLAFLFSRYKFVAKMFSGMNRVLEVGCADAFATRVVLQEVKSVTAIDFDPVFVADVQKRMNPRWKFECFVHDMLSGPVVGGFDGVYSLDVLEHIATADEDRFVENIVGSLNENGVCMVGTPSIHSQVFATAQSKAGHVNCKDAPGLKALMQKFFQNVFIFSMNDEVVHTGYYPMAQYLFALCCHPK